MISKPTCPVCQKTISFLEVQRTFKCPHCSSDLKSSGQGTVMAFEIGAFVILGWLLSAAVINGHYVLAALVLAGWLGAEYVIRNQFLTVEVAS